MGLLFAAGQRTPSSHARENAHEDLERTFADAIFVSVVVLILVELAEKSRSALHPVHAGHRAVAVLPSAGRTDLATAAVIQDGACAPLRPAAALRGASVRAVHRVLDTGSPRLSIAHKKWGQDREEEKGHHWVQLGGPALESWSDETERRRPPLGDPSGLTGGSSGCKVISNEQLCFAHDLPPSISSFRPPHPHPFPPWHSDPFLEIRLGSGIYSAAPSRDLNRCHLMSQVSFGLFFCDQQPTTAPGGRFHWIRVPIPPPALYHIRNIRYYQR